MHLFLLFVIMKLQYKSGVFIHALKNTFLNIFAHCMARSYL